LSHSTALCVSYLNFCRTLIEWILSSVIIALKGIHVIFITSFLHRYFICVYLNISLLFFSHFLTSSWCHQTLKYLLMGSF
jgi:hypothetical protein